MYTGLIFYYHSQSHVSDKKTVSRNTIDETTVSIKLPLKKYSKCLQIFNLVKIQGRNKNQKEI